MSVVLVARARGRSSAPEGPPADLVFHSDWSTATGATDTAFLDTGKSVPWTRKSDYNDHDLIVDAATEGVDAGCPTTNCLKSYFAGGTEGQDNSSSHNMILDDTVPVPGVGESIYYRWYWRHAVPDASAQGTSFHPIEDGPNGGSTNWSFNPRPVSAGLWRAAIRFLGPVTDPQDDRFDMGDTLNKDEWYRFELHALRADASNMTYEVRVYDDTDTLIADSSDFLNTSAEPLDTKPIPINVEGNLAHFQCGTNGPTWAGAGATKPFVISYQAAFAIRTDDWCGPYANGV